MAAAARCCWRSGNVGSTAGGSVATQGGQLPHVMPTLPARGCGAQQCPCSSCQLPAWNRVSVMGQGVRRVGQGVRRGSSPSRAPAGACRAGREALGPRGLSAPVWPARLLAWHDPCPSHASDPPGDRLPPRETCQLPAGKAPQRQWWSIAPTALFWRGMTSSVTCRGGAAMSPCGV
jgi:hypothetical protein